MWRLPSGTKPSLPGLLVWHKQTLWYRICAKLCVQACFPDFTEYEPPPHSLGLMSVLTH